MQVTGARIAKRDGQAGKDPFVVTRLTKKNQEKTLAFQRQFNEKPSIIPGCPRTRLTNINGRAKTE